MKISVKPDTSFDARYDCECGIVIGIVNTTGIPKKYTWLKRKDIDEKRIRKIEQS